MFEPLVIFRLYLGIVWDCTPANWLWFSWGWKHQSVYLDHPSSHTCHVFSPWFWMIVGGAILEGLGLSGYTDSWCPFFGCWTGTPRWWLPLRTFARGDSSSKGRREARAEAHRSEGLDHSGLYPHWQVAMALFFMPGLLSSISTPQKKGYNKYAK